MNSRPDRNNQAGFSLFEMLIVLCVMLIVVGSIFSLMGDAIKVGLTTSELTDAQESLRTAQEHINRDLIVAGDGLRGINTIRVPVGFVETYLALNPVIDPTEPDYVNLPIIVPDDDVPGATPATDTVPAVNVQEGTDRLTLLTVDAGFAPISLSAESITSSGEEISISPDDLGRFNVGDIYLVTSQVGATFGVVTDVVADDVAPSLIFDAGDEFGLNGPGDGGPINVISRGGTLPASLLRMQIINYFVNENDLLIRRVFGVGGGLGFTDSVIAEHVPDLQFRFFLNLRDADGNMRQPASQLWTSEELIAVRQVEVSVTAETTHPINVRKDADSGTTIVTPHRIRMTTSTSVRNMQFLQALQPRAE